MTKKLNPNQYKYLPNEQNIEKYFLFTHCRYVNARRNEVNSILKFYNENNNTNYHILFVFNYILYTYHRLTYNEISKLIGIHTKVTVYKHVTAIHNLRSKHKMFNYFIESVMEYRKHENKKGIAF